MQWCFFLMKIFETEKITLCHLNPRALQHPPPLTISPSGPHRDKPADTISLTAHLFGSGGLIGFPLLCCLLDLFPQLLQSEVTISSHRLSAPPTLPSPLSRSAKCSPSRKTNHQKSHYAALSLIYSLHSLLDKVLTEVI